MNFRIVHLRIALIIVGKSWALSNISQQKESFGFREMLICEWRWCQVGFLKTHLDPLLAKGKDVGPRLWVGTLAFQQECGCEGKRVDVLTGQGSSSLTPISWILALCVVNLWVKLVEEGGQLNCCFGNAQNMHHFPPSPDVLTPFPVWAPFPRL